MRRVIARPYRLVAVICACLGLLGHSLGVGSPSALAATRRPNILVFLTDDQRADTMEVMPATRRWFMDAGTTFENAFVTTPLCCPSRATIFTGRYAHNHLLKRNKDARRLDQATTIQRYLHDRGYLTAIAGKFLNSWPIWKRPPHFDRWSVFRWGYYDTSFNVQGSVRRVSNYSTTFIRRRAVRYLRWFERRDRRPWLLFVHTSAPHGPFTAEERFAEATVPAWDPGPGVDEGDRSDKPPFVQARNRSREQGENVRAGQLRTLMSVDVLVGRVMRELRNRRELGRTLAFFLSDNGYLWSEHGLPDKRLPYQEAIRIPMMMRWPGRVTGGVTDARLVTNADIVPTIRQAARVPVRALKRPFDGRSLVTPFERDRIFTEYWLDPRAKDIPTWASILTPGYQYSEYYPEAGQPIAEYYDLAADPHQLENLLGDAHPDNDPTDDVLAELSGQLARDRACRGTGSSWACP